MSAPESPGIAATPKPPFYAVIFTSVRTDKDFSGYDAMAAKMAELAARQFGDHLFDQRDTLLDFAYPDPHSGIDVAFSQHRYVEAKPVVGRIAQLAPRIEGAARDMIEGVMEMRDARVARIMTPRTSMVTVPVDAPLADVLRVATESAHTRLPILSMP